MPRLLADQIQGTYFRLRFTVAILGLLFPVILYFGGRMNSFGLRGSMSAYYWATPDAPCRPGRASKMHCAFTRNWKVASIFGGGT